MSLLMAEAEKALTAHGQRIVELEAELVRVRIRLARMMHAWERLRDSPQSTPDIRAVAVGFVGEKVSA